MNLAEMNSMNYRIDLPQLGQVLNGEPGDNLYQLLAAAGLLDAPCGGNGTCGKCQVIIDGEERLSCTYQVNSDIMVLRPQQTHLQSITADGYLKDFTPDPWPQAKLWCGGRYRHLPRWLLPYMIWLRQAIDSPILPQFAEGLGQDVISRINHAVSYEKGLGGAASADYH